jgi:hypothetical protein
MKILATILLVAGTFLAFVAPRFLEEYSIGAEIGAESPPRTFQFSVATVVRVIGIVSMAFCALCFIVSANSHGR